MVIFRVKQGKTTLAVEKAIKFANKNTIVEVTHLQTVAVFVFQA